MPETRKTFTFDGRKVSFQDGDTVASALHRAGIRSVSRSMKYHRPRGLYCMAGSCGGCLVDVDNVPNTPACMEGAREGATVTSQNRIGSAKRDLLRAVDVVYPHGFDPHGAFARPGWLNRIFVRLVRRMSGWGKAPAPDTPTTRRGRRHQRTTDELVVGAGHGGLRRALDAASAGANVVLVEEGESLGGPAAWDGADPTIHDLVAAVQAHPGIETWTEALVFGIYNGQAAVRRGDDLWEVDADRISLATGHHDAWPMFTNNDLPGVLSLRGAQRLWYGHGVLPGRRIVCHGGRIPERFAHDLRQAGAELVAWGKVSAVKGHGRVKRAQVDGRWVRADTVVCVLPGVPRVELYQQAGCELTWRNGPAPVLGEDGATSVPGIHGVEAAP